MIFDENCVLADNSHEISYLVFFPKIRKDVAKVVCCSRDWHFKGKAETMSAKCIFTIVKTVQIPLSKMAAVDLISFKIPLQNHLLD